MFSNSNQTNRNFETLMVSLSIFLKSKNKDFKMGRSKSTLKALKRKRKEVKALTLITGKYIILPTVNLIAVNLIAVNLS